MSTNHNKDKRRVAPGRRPIKVTPRRKKELDPHLIALCYFLIAQRIVREADQGAAPANGDAGGDVPLDAERTVGPEDRP